MSYQDWADLLFENGCRFIEKNIKINYLQIALLQNPALGFWDWWLIVSIEDDENLTSYSEVTSFSAYIKEKERMLHLMERVKQFDFFLIKNDKLNELAKV